MQEFVPVSQCKDTYYFDKTKQFSKNYLLAFVFSRDFQRPKGRNLNIFLKVREKNGLKSGRLACLHCVRLCRLSRVQDLRSACVGPLVVCSVAFCPLSRFVLVGLPANMALFRILRGFLAGFPCWMYVCIARVLCVACGAFVRVWS